MTGPIGSTAVSLPRSTRGGSRSVGLGLVGAAYFCVTTLAWGAPSSVPAPAASAPASVLLDSEKKPIFKVVDWTENRFVVGDPRKFERPARITILDVMSKIPAYQQVIKEKLTEKDPRYYFLMQEATQQLVAAVERVTRKTGHDLVADSGAVEAEGGEIPDITQAVIDALKK